jgi:hypothetical protein
MTGHVCDTPAARPPVVLVTTTYWQGLEYQHHHLARKFAAHGHRVFFIERTPQRWPRPGVRDLRAWFRGAGYGSETTQQPVPENITVVTPRWLPPARCLRPVNRALIRHTAEQLPKTPPPVLIAYVPSYNTLDLVERLRPCVTAYVSVFVYENTNVVKDLLRSEREFARSCDVLYATCPFLERRLRDLTGRRDIHLSLHGVDYAAFASAHRGDELARRRVVGYFGGIGPHLDLEFYGRLAAGGRKVVFLGVVDPAVRGRIPPAIEVRPPVPSSQLPDALREIDVFAIVYKPSPYMRGVISAKLFECLATAKPLLVSGWPEARRYLDCLYDVENSADKAERILADLPTLHTPERRERQRRTAEDADWDRRFEAFRRCLTQPLEEPEHDGRGT